MAEKGKEGKTRVREKIEKRRKYWMWVLIVFVIAPGNGIAKVVREC